MTRSRVSLNALAARFALRKAKKWKNRLILRKK